MILTNQAAFTNEDGETHTCVDNAMSCFGKLIYYHSSSGLITPAMIVGFMLRLPVITDLEEAQQIHLQFIK